MARTTPAPTRSRPPAHPAPRAPARRATPADGRPLTGGRFGSPMWFRDDVGDLWLAWHGILLVLATGLGAGVLIWAAAVGAICLAVPA